MQQGSTAERPGGDAAARVACVWLPAFALQRLAQDFPPALRTAPLAVVSAVGLNAEVQWVNQAAHVAGVRRGMRYGQALSFAPDLVARPVAPAALQAAAAGILRALSSCSPWVEAAREALGLFWLRAAGLQRLYPGAAPGDFDVAAWAAHIAAVVAAAPVVAEETPVADASPGAPLAATGGGQWCARVVVGFDKWATVALARQTAGVTLLSSRAEEQQRVQGVPLALLDLSMAQRDALDALGVRCLGDLGRLPPRGLADRFGPSLLRWWRVAHGEPTEPIEAHHATEAIGAERDFDAPLSQQTQLLFALKGVLAELLPRLQARGERCLALQVSLLLDDRSEEAFWIYPDLGGRGEGELVDLLRLRLERLSLAAGVRGLRLRLHGVPWSGAQGALFVSPEQADLARAARCMNRLRAEFGAQSLCLASPRAQHLPEDQASLARATALHAPQPAPTSPAGSDTVAVRRLYEPPLRLGARLCLEGDVPICCAGHSLGRVRRAWGPFALDGRWWAQPVARRYYYVETSLACLLWIYEDRHAGQWYLHASF